MTKTYFSSKLQLSGDILRAATDAEIIVKLPLLLTLLTYLHVADAAFGAVDFSMPFGCKVPTHE